MTQSSGYVLGVHPSVRGFGWALFENSGTLVDWAAVELNGNKNARVLKRIAAILDKYQPVALALEALEANRKGRSPRVRRLHRAIVALGRRRGCSIRLYSRAQVRDRFAPAQTREEIAGAIAGIFEALRPRWRGPRRAWDPEAHNLGLFCAVGCVLTHYANASLPA